MEIIFKQFRIILKHLTRLTLIHPQRLPYLRHRVIGKNIQAANIPVWRLDFSQ